MFLIDQIILAGGLLLLVGTLSSKFSTRLGLPVLVLFLGLGMVAGEDGLGIEFDNFVIAHAIGTLALAFILFDGGLQTRVPALKVAWKPSAWLATLGVGITALITGLAAAWIIGLPLESGLLLGSIVASTDAAAVFSVLRGQGMRLRTRIAATLEVESGSNDPMAIFLTVGILEVITESIEPGAALLVLFLKQMGIGAAVGLGAGWLSVHMINRINLGAAGLYPVLVGGCGLATFGFAAAFGGSGFLAIYLAGILIGNSRVVFQRGTFLFMDGLAWMGQITMFVVLGLLSDPTELFDVAGPGLLVSAVLIFVARPIAVVPLLLPFKFNVREIVLIAWVGLKGAVPIILATFPLMYGIAEGGLIFDIVFFVVLVSATLQGWTLPWLAKRLHLQKRHLPAPPLSLELMALRDVNAEILYYLVSPESGLGGKMVRDLHLPEDSLLAMIVREGALLPPRGSTELAIGDHVFVITKAENRRFVDRLFGGPGDDA